MGGNVGDVQAGQGELEVLESEVARDGLLDIEYAMRE
jgi:hypothetical protein